MANAVSGNGRFFAAKVPFIFESVVRRKRIKQEYLGEFMLQHEESRALVEREHRELEQLLVQNILKYSKIYEKLARHLLQKLCQKPLAHQLLREKGSRKFVLHSLQRFRQEHSILVRHEKSLEEKMLGFV